MILRAAVSGVGMVDGGPGSRSPAILKETKEFYRILAAPPGYAPHQKDIVSAYQNPDSCSKTDNIRMPDGTLFAATLEEARRVIPPAAKQLPFAPEYQFLELWESRDEE